MKYVRTIARYVLGNATCMYMNMNIHCMYLCLESGCCEIALYV